jgi:hypothetical protein
VLLAEHALEDGSFRRQFSNVRRIEPATKDLLEVLVLLDHDDDVVVDREVRRPRQAVGCCCDARSR